MNWFINNREMIRNLQINTGTSAVPSFTNLCTTSECSLAVDMEQKDFFVFCDAIKRSIITGATLTLKATVKIDMNNSAIEEHLKGIHTILESGTVAQFNNQLVRFELLEKVQTSALTYKKYEVPVNVKIGELGGAAENEGSYSLEMTINGKGTIVTA